MGGPSTPCPRWPLLAKVRRDDLDAALERRGLRFARSAADFRLVVRSPAAGPRVLRRMRRCIEGRLRLRLNWPQRKAARLSADSCLGCELKRGKRRWTDAAVTRFQERSRAITARRNGRSTAPRIEALHRSVTGGRNYFGHSHSYAARVELDRWRRVRLG
jgi:hypothetical protein